MPLSCKSQLLSFILCYVMQWPSWISLFILFQKDKIKFYAVEKQWKKKKTEIISPCTVIKSHIEGILHLFYSFKHQFQLSHGDTHSAILMFTLFFVTHRFSLNRFPGYVKHFSSFFFILLLLLLHCDGIKYVHVMHGMRWIHPIWLMGNAPDVHCIWIKHYKHQ